jgi:uncharacterized membrane protein
MRLHFLMLFLHLIGVVAWVGGMAFVYLCLRPALGILPPPQRLGLMRDVLGRFFPMVWVALACILVSGPFMLLEVGMRQAPRAWHLMLLIGLVMTAVFLSIWFGPWKRLEAAVDREDWAAGAGALNLIRQRVAFNLVLGLVTIAAATLGLGL